MNAPGAVLITGGAGFIGSNLAHRLAGRGRDVVILDNLSRHGVEQNAAWLRSAHGNRIRIDPGDVRHRDTVRKCLDGVTEVFHLAAQVAVTASLTDPLTDFDVNARGTLNLLEEICTRQSPPSLIFTSTNKVYGDLADLKLHAEGTRYVPADAALAARGIGELQPLSFHSPYGCSKGAADQYVLDYARIYGLKAAVFRMSCIYGPHQLGKEDQGWLAHFIIRVIEGAPLTIFGDGRQVRDVLFVEDLVDAFLLAQEQIAHLAGQAFNIGGGPDNTVSLLELLDLAGQLRGSLPPVRFDSWRMADQRYYISDTGRFRAATGWAPKIGVPEGVRRLYQWLLEQRDAPTSSLPAGGRAA
jgi:CDP-paratose 2-epimerase